MQSRHAAAVVGLCTVLVLACSLSFLRIPGSTLASTPTPASTATSGPAGDATEESAIRDLVGNFGKRLQDVSLLAPDAAQELQRQYSEFVSPSLLEVWMKDPLKAPGRLVSSPWPDRIEISALTKEAPDRYLITGFVVEVTSQEVTSGGAAARNPVQIVVQRDQGRWLITEYSEQR